MHIENSKNHKKWCCPPSHWRSIDMLLNNSACCNNVFSLGQTDGHRYRDSPLPKTSSWMENCTKFGQLILSKITKIVATSCQILRLKMHQIRFRLGLRPRPRWGSSQRSPRPSTGLEGPTSNGRAEKGRGKEGRGEEERGGKEERGGREGRGRRGEERWLLSWKTVSLER